MLDKSYADLEEIKRALLIASPQDFAQKVFPEIFGAPKNSDIDEVFDTINEDGSTPEIDFDLIAPPSAEAKRIVDLVMGDQSGTLQL